MRIASIFLCAAAVMSLAGCAQKAQQPQLTASGLNPANFEAVIDGDKQVKLYTLTNANGMEVCVTNYGGRVVSLLVPGADGEMRDVVLGFDSIADYQNIPSDFGASIGRYANRIDHGKIEIDGQQIQLPVNNFGHCLHGGPTGWQYRPYKAEQTSGNSLTLTMESPDGDNNFPGNVTAAVTYTLTDDNALDIAYSATTDKKTVINMTHHSYFNLSGDPSQSATDHVLYINADSYTPVDSTYMPTGEVAPVAGTPMDFTTPKPVGQDIETPDNEQLKNAQGYDHNWILNTGGDINQLAASLYSPTSGIKVEVYTDEPGIQVYSGNFLVGEFKGKRGIAYQNRPSICLETQHFPDSPNHPEWPTVLLEPGQTYSSHCIYRFSVE